MDKNEMLDRTLMILYEKGIIGISLDSFLESEFNISDTKAIYAFKDLINDKDIANVDQHFTARITPLGTNIQEFGGWLKYQETKKSEAKRQREKEDLDFEKSKVDLDLAKKMLKEYPKTKWIARISFIIGIGLALLEIARATGLL